MNYQTTYTSNPNQNYHVTQVTSTNYPVYRPVVQPMVQQTVVQPMRVPQYQQPPQYQQRQPQYQQPPQYQQQQPQYQQIQPPSYPNQVYQLPPPMDPLYNLMTKTLRMKQIADMIFGKHTTVKEYYMTKDHRRELKRDLSEIVQLLDSVTIEVNVSKDALLNKNYQSLLLSGIQSIQRVLTTLEGAVKIIAFPPKTFIGYVSSRVVRSLCLELEEKTKNCTSSFGLNLNVRAEAEIQGFSGVSVFTQKDRFVEATQKEKQDNGGNFAHVIPPEF